MTPCAALRGEVFPHSVNAAENVTLPFWSKLQLHWTEICTTDDGRQHISKGATETLGGAMRSQHGHPSGPALVTQQCKEAGSTAAPCSLGGHPLQDILVSYKTKTQNSINRINTPIYRTLTHIHTWCVYGTPLVGNPRNCDNGCLQEGGTGQLVGDGHKWDLLADPSSDFELCLICAYYFKKLNYLKVEEEYTACGGSYIYSHWSSLYRREPKNKIIIVLSPSWSPETTAGEHLSTFSDSYYFAKLYLRFFIFRAHTSPIFN